MATIGDQLIVQGPFAVEQRAVVADRLAISSGSVYKGMLTYDLNDSKLYTFVGDDLGDASDTSNWSEIASPSSIDNLTDVTITNPTDGQVLTYDFANSIWVNANPSVVTTGTLSSAMLSNVTFNENGGTATLTVSGNAGVTFSLSLNQVEPAGWITSGALGATAGALGANGMFTTTITIPTNNNDVDNAAAIVATNNADTSNTVTTGLFRQLVGHGTSGDLTVAFIVDVTGNSIFPSASITGGDEPFTLELFDTDPTSGSPTALETLTVTGAATRTSPQVATFTTIDASALADGDHTYFLRTTDSGAAGDLDVVIETETITVTGVEPDFYGWGTVPTNFYLNAINSEICQLNQIAPESATTSSFTVTNTRTGMSLNTQFFGTSGETYPLSAINNVNMGNDISDFAIGGDVLRWEYTDIGVSPNNLIENTTTIVNNSAIATFNQIEFNGITFFQSGFGPQSVRLYINGYANPASFDYSWGYDFIEGDHFDSFPSSGLTREVADSSSTPQVSPILTTSRIPLTNGVQYTLRPFIANALDPDDATLINFGPLLVVTPF